MGWIDGHYRRDSDEAAEERGHRRVHCRTHGYKGWSDDCGVAPCCYNDLDAAEHAARCEKQSEEGEGSGMKVKYLGASEEQIRWGGNDDPRPLLTLGQVYEVEEKEVHSWHTKIRLVGIVGQFNDSSFEYCEDAP